MESESRDPTQSTDDRLDAIETVSIHDMRRSLSALSPPNKTAAEVANELGISTRRAGYFLDAARVIDWVSRTTPQLTLPIVSSSNEPSAARTSFLYEPTETGIKFLETTEGSDEEKLQLSKALMGSATLRRFASGFMIEDMTAEQLGRKLQLTTGLSFLVSKRRAEALLTWKQAALGASQAKHTITTNEVVDNIEPPELEIPIAIHAYMCSQLAQARIALLIGSGLSRGCLTSPGYALPTKIDLAKYIWQLCFPDSKVDPNVDLDELVQVAVQRNPKGLAILLKDNFTIAPSSVDATQTLLLAAPWSKIYTLAVDDLEHAIHTHSALTRRPFSLTGMDDTQIATADRLPVIHLHGVAHHGTARFAVAPEHSLSLGLSRLLERFDSDYFAYPFVALATEDDIDDVWKYIERRGRKARRGTRELRPKSILVCPTLSAVRIALAKEFNVEYVRGEPKLFIERLLRPLHLEFISGHDLLRTIAAATTDGPNNIVSVSEALTKEKPHKTEYLLGQQPTWDDILSSRAISRESDTALLTEIASSLRRRTKQSNSGNASIVSITGTAGAGKSTALMRLAIELSAQGHKTAWIGSGNEISPRSIKSFGKRASGFSVIMLDELERYGSRAAETVVSLAESPGIQLVVVSLHSSRMAILKESILFGFFQQTFVMPPLADSDINSLIEAMDADHRLGILKGKTRAYQESVFREQAGRSLLVAMIQATSGRRFEEKVYEEWKALPERSNYFYTVITIASHLGYTLTRDELIRAGDPTNPDDLAGIELLSSGDLIAKLDRDRFRSRHSLIAETLMKELVGKHELEAPYRNLAFSVTHLLGPDSRTSSRGRFVKKLIGYRELNRVLDLDGARAVYEMLEEHMHWDYHYWLQRGSLEVSEGDVQRAEQYLSYAKGMNPNDNLVITEYAYMLMRRAVSEARTADAATLLEEGAQMLRGQIANRGEKDYHPYHVLGSQAIAWITRCAWSRDEKIRFLSVVSRDMSDGARRHPKQLEQVARDVQTRLISVTAGLA